MATEHFHAVVIGSGFGGSVVTQRLADAGRSVLLLERGQPYPPGSFPRTPNDLRAAFWDPSGGHYGLLDLWAFDELDAAVASGLGGGSLIYANVMLRKDEATFVFEDGSLWPVTRKELEPHYDAVERMQQPERFPLGQGRPYAATGRTLAMLEGANALRLRAELPPLAVRFAPVAGGRAAPGITFDDGLGNLHGAVRRTCRLCAECDFGCNDGAKSTLDLTFLSTAFAAGAEIRCCCEARVIERIDGGFRVSYRQHLGAREGHPAHLLDPSAEELRTVEATHLVLAAGAVATPYLLLANRAGLPGLSPALGSRVSGNGDYIAWVRNARRSDGRWRYLDPSDGPVITASIAVGEERSPSGRSFLIQDAGAPAFTEWLWQLGEMPGDMVRAASPAVRRLVDRLRGRRETAASGFVASLLGDAHASAAMMPLLGMGDDVPNGRYRLVERRLELDWSLAPSQDYYDGVRATMEELARALGGELMSDPLDRWRRSISVHMVGGAPMGEGPHEGVVDGFGRVFGHPGLWIADGSAMPGPVGVNPSFTIAAFADRVASAMLEGAPA